MNAIVFLAHEETFLKMGYILDPNSLGRMSLRLTHFDDTTIIPRELCISTNKPSRRSC